MKFKLIIALLVLTFTIKAQVKDINYTLSPTAEYIFWGDGTGIEDGLIYGGKVGLGFGEYFELRALYMFSNNLETQPQSLESISNNPSLNTLQSRDITKFKRFGGEIKANIGNGRFSPYLLLGGGVQSLEIDSIDNKPEHIFLSAGLGVKFKLTDRIVFNLEGRNTAFRFNPVYLLSDNDITNLGLTTADFEQETFSNWSVSGSLQFYLGGNRSKTDDYTLNFKNGIKSIQGTVEPTIQYLDFDNSLGFRDTWFAGINAGINLGPYVGIRAFYNQALEEDEFTSFDKLAMYGGEIRLKLNKNDEDIVPFILLGGGKFDVSNKYLADSISIGGVNQIATVKDQNFLSAGLGLNIPVSKNIELFGSAKGIFTSNTSEDDINSIEQINTSMSYGGGVRIKFGKSTQTLQNQRTQDYVKTTLSEKDKQHNLEIETLKKEYEAEIEELNAQIALAKENENTEKVVELELEKNKLEKITQELEKQTIRLENVEPVIIEKEVVTEPQKESEISLTPQEFIEIIDAIYDNEEGGNSTSTQKVETTETKSDTNKEDQEMNTVILDKIELLDRKIELQNRKIEAINQSNSEIKIIEAN